MFEDANKLLERVKMELSFQEENFVKQSLATRAILYPKLLIKYHNTINKKGKSPTRLVIHANNFTETFSTIGYLGIKKMPCKGKVNYSHVSTVHASNLKERPEEPKIKRDEVTIESIDAINM